jgi:hypothetical protein
VQPSAAQVRALPKLRTSGSEFGPRRFPSHSTAMLGLFPLAGASQTLPRPLHPAPATSQLNTRVRALAISQGILGSYHPEGAVWRNNLGGVLQAHGDLAGARVQYERALSIGEAALARLPSRDYLPRRPGERLQALQEPSLEGPSSSLELFLNPGEHKCFILRLALGGLSCG